MFSFYIAMPGGTRSQPRSHSLHVNWVTINNRTFRLIVKEKDFDEDSLMKEVKHISAILRSWPGFEAYIILLEDDVEISREHILGKDLDAEKQATRSSVDEPISSPS